MEVAFVDRGKLVLQSADGERVELDVTDFRVKLAQRDPEAVAQVEELLERIRGGRVVLESRMGAHVGKAIADATRAFRDLAIPEVAATDTEAIDRAIQALTRSTLAPPPKYGPPPERRRRGRGRRR